MLGSPSITDLGQDRTGSAVHECGRGVALKVRVFGFFVCEPDESDGVLQSMAQHDSPEIVSADDKQSAKQNGKLHYYRDRPRALVQVN